MANILDYLDWRGDLTFAQSPFQAVDNLILSCLSYIHFGGIVEAEGEEGVPLPLADALFSASGEEKERVRSPLDGELLHKAAKSRRFRDARLYRYVNRLNLQEEKQFAAVAFQLGDGSLYIAYRGTDNTLVGWKEDFNMSFLPSVPAQQEALAYLQEIGRRLPGSRLRAGGHSKGGNLAVYAASCAEPALQDRLLAVYNNDGPGFCCGLPGGAGHARAARRIQTFVPQSSVVGMLMEHDEAYTVIKSSGAGLLQHDPYSWEVMGPDFLRLEAVTEGSRLVDRTLKDWLSQLSPEERKQFADTLYQILTATGAVRLKDLSAGWLKNSLAMLHAAGNLKKESKEQLARVFTLLLSSAGRTMLRSLPEGPF